MQCKLRLSAVLYLLLMRLHLHTHRERKKKALLFGSNESRILCQTHGKPLRNVTVLLSKGTVMLHYGKRLVLCFGAWKFCNAPLLCFEVSINLLLNVNICVLLWWSVTSLRGRRVCDSGLALVCIHVLGRRWSLQQGGKPSWFPLQTPLGSRRSGT